MENDFLQSLQYIGATARIKRLSDSLLYDARKVYEQIQLGIEPNWHLIFLLLKQEGPLPVTVIARRLQFSHPAIIKIVKKMQAQGYLASLPDANDSRRQLIQLTQQSLDRMPEFEQEWQRIETVIRQLFDADILQQLARLEQNVAQKGLYHRYNDINNDTTQ